MMRLTSSNLRFLTRPSFGMTGQVFCFPHIIISFEKMENDGNVISTTGEIYFYIILSSL